MKKNTKSIVQVGVIGCGYWGPNLIRNFNALEDVQLSFCCDTDTMRLSEIKRKYPRITTTKNYKDLIKNKSLDALVIAAPVSLHFPMALEALKFGKHVFIEKPMAASVSQAKKLVEAAGKKKKVLMVDHTFVYSEPIKVIKKIISGKELGKLYYFDSVRINLGLFQHDINVMWDLAPHDLSIMDFLLDEKPVCVSAIGSSHIQKQPENLAYITVRFNNNLIAHFHVNWLSPVKIRRILIGGSEKMLLYDDMDAAEKVKIYDKGVQVQTLEDIHRTRISYRSGQMTAPNIQSTEPLSVACAHFVQCIRENKKPVTDGEAGLRVVRILEAATKSVRNDGEFVFIK